VRAYGLRVPIVLAAAAAVLSVLFFLQFLLQRQAVSLPLVTRLRDVRGVVGQPAVSNNGSELDVAVHLGSVPDLPVTYNALLQAAGAGSGTHVVLQILDTRTPALIADLDSLYPILDQGRQTGEFVTMDQQFDAKAKTLGLDSYQLLLGQTQMYVTLALDGHYLYEILPLTLPSGGAGGGSAS
jgi:hypothetical protein